MAARARFVVGVACVAVAAVLFALELPRVVRSTDRQASGYGYLKTRTQRLVTSGDVLGISRDLQLAALSDIPPGSTYALLLQPNPDVAERVYGIAPVTAAVTPPFLTYLLLPSEAVAAGRARYIICWGCDTTPWDGRTTWLFGNAQGVTIGRVNGR